MMRLRLSRASLRDLAEAVAHAAAENPQAARRLHERILAAAEALRNFAAMASAIGQDRRILSVPGTPFRLIYRERADSLTIPRVLHGARQWPPASD